MKALMKAALGTLLLSCLASAPAVAMGPVDGEVDAFWWANDFDASGLQSAVPPGTDAAAPSYSGELWIFKRYGFRAGRYSSDLGDVGRSTSDTTSLDFMWKAFSPTENNFLAVGAGWQEMDMPSIGLDSTSGARLSAEGRVAIIGVLQLFAQLSYYPSLDDGQGITPADGRFEDMSGSEYEFGLIWKLAPFVHLRAGYRESSVDFTRIDLSGALNGSAESSGFLVGMGVHF